MEPSEIRSKNVTAPEIKRLDIAKIFAAMV